MKISYPYRPWRRTLWALVFLLLSLAGRSQAQVFYLTTDGGTSLSATDALNRMDYNGANMTAIAPSITPSPLLLSLDPAGNRAFVYEGVTANRGIKVFGNLNTTPTLLYTLPVPAQVSAIEYDAASDYVYFLTTDNVAATTSASDALNRIKADNTGTNQVLIASLTTSPIYLALNTAANRAYVYEGLAASRGIKTINLATNTVIGTTTTVPAQVAALEYAASNGYLYYLTTDGSGTSGTATAADALYRTQPDNQGGNTASTAVITSVTNAPAFLSLDLANNRIYVADNFNTTRGFVVITTNSTGATSTGTQFISQPTQMTAVVVAQVLPAVTTTTPASITGTNAVLGGNVTTDGGTTVTGRGVVYSVNSTNSNPTLGGTGTTTAANGSGTGSFSATIAGLAPNTTYAVAAYATNSVGTDYGTVLTFTTAALPAVTALAPPSGPVGTNVTITATGFALGATVTFNGTTATTVTVNSATQITATVPTGATTGNVVVTTSAGSSPAAAANVFTVTQPTTVTSITTTTTSPTNAASISYMVTFGASVTGVTTGNFSLSPTVMGASIASVSGTGTTYTVTVNTGTGSGPLQLNLANAMNLSPSVSNVPYAGPSTTIDKTAPTVTISSSAGSSGSTTATTPIPFTVTFSENVTGFGAGDVSVTNGTITGGTVNGASPGTMYTFTVTPATPGTATTVNVAANVAVDQANNGNTASSQFSITYQQPLVASAQAVTVNLDANGNATLNASSVNNGSTGSGTLTYTIQKIAFGYLPEGTTPLTLTTPNGANFTQIRFASYGTPTNSTSGNYRLGSCNAANSLAAAQNAYVGRSSGSLYPSNTDTRNNPVLGDPCGGTPKALAVQAAYSADAASLAYDCTEAGKTQYVLLTVTNGTSTSTSVAQVTVNAPPTATISSVSPTAAQRGATVTVAGTNLSGVSSVTVNGAVATVSNLTSTGFTFVVPGTATFGTGSIVVATPCAQTLTNAFSVTAPALTATVSTTSASPTSTAPIPFSVTFSQSVGTTFTASDVTVAGGTVTSGSFSGSGAGPYTFTVTPSGTGTVVVSLAASVANDANNTPNTASNSVSVQFQAPTIVVAPASLPQGTQNTAYSQALSASGGTAPYTYAITAGALPSGLSLNTSGTIAGTPTTNGTFNFTVTATDASAAPGPYSGSSSYSLVITAPAITATTWTGTISTDWFTANNWSPNTVPNATIDATIPTAPSGGRFPALSAGTANVRNLTFNSGATLNQSGGTLAIAANLTNNGTFLPTGGTVNLGTTTLSSVLGNGNIRFWNLAVGANGAQLSTSIGASVQRLLTLNGNFATNGNQFVLESNNTLTALVVNNNSNVVTGTVTVQRAIDPSVNPGLGYRHYSAPVSNSTVGDLATSGFTPVVNPAFNTVASPYTITPYPTVYGYDDSRLTLTNNLDMFDKGYFSPSALSDPLAVGKGYTVNIAASELVDFQGTLNNGDLSLNLTSTRNTYPEGGWQFLGNPYPAPLDYSRVAPADRSGLESAIYVYSSTDQYMGYYRVYINGIGNPVVPLGQGFFTRAASGRTTANMTFRNSQRLTAPNGTTLQRPTADPRPLVQLTLQSQGAAPADETYVYFENGATSGFEPAFDAEKLPNPTGFNLSTTQAGKQLSIDGQPELGTAQRVVPLAVGVPAAGVYTFTASQLLNLNTTPVYLRDRQLGTLTDLRQQPTYQFTVSNAAALNTTRFELVFSPQQVLATVPAALAQQVAVYPNPATSQATIELPAALSRQPATATLLDALGRVVRQQALPAGQAAHVLPVSDLATGVYSLRLATEAGVVVKKLVVE